MANGKAIAGALLSGVKTADELWKVINKNGRFVSWLQETNQKIAAKLKSPDPVTQLEGKLDLVQSVVTDFTTDVDEDQVEEWLRRARRMQTKLPLLRTLEGKARKDALKGMTRQVDALLTEVLRHGEPDEPVAEQQPPETAEGHGRRWRVPLPRWSSKKADGVEGEPRDSDDEGNTAETAGPASTVDDPDTDS